MNYEAGYMSCKSEREFMDKVRKDKIFAALYHPEKVESIEAARQKTAKYRNWENVNR